MSGTITVEQQPDGSVVLMGTFPPMVCITRELLEDALPNLLRRRFRTIDLTFANARAVYRIIGIDKEWNVYRARRQYVEPAELAGA